VKNINTQEVLISPVKDEITSKEKRLKKPNTSAQLTAHIFWGRSYTYRESVYGTILTVSLKPV